MNDSMEKQIEFQKYYIPETWMRDPDSQVLVTAHRIINYGDFLPSLDQCITDFEDIRVGFFFGTLAFPAFEEDWDFSTKDHALKLNLNQKEKNKEGAWIIFFQRIKSNEEAVARKILSGYLALYISIFGPTIAYTQEFQHIYNANGTISFTGTMILNPLILGKPLLTDERFAFIKIFGEKINLLPPREKERIKLSLHWCEKGFRSHGIDAFLNSWIALEALAMPNNTNIKRIRKILREIYHPETHDAEDRFYVGKIFGLRNDIVHNGLAIPIRHIILDYIQCIYIDVLFFTLEFPSEKRTLAILSQSKEKIEESLRY